MKLEPIATDIRSHFSRSNDDVVMYSSGQCITFNSKGNYFNTVVLFTHSAYAS